MLLFALQLLHNLKQQMNNLEHAHFIFTVSQFKIISKTITSVKLSLINKFNCFGIFVCFLVLVSWVLWKILQIIRTICCYYHYFFCFYLPVLGPGGNLEWKTCDNNEWSDFYVMQYHVWGFKKSHTIISLFFNWFKHAACQSFLSGSGAPGWFEPVVWPSLNHKKCDKW